MNVIQGAILGLVQGLGEFLPISSSGHLLLARMLMGLSDASLTPEQLAAFKMLDILLHAGTLIPILVVFWKDWLDMLLHPIRNRTLLLLFIASLPTLVFYVLFDMHIFDNGWFLGVAFLITALLLVLYEVVDTRRATHREEVGVPQALAMGVMQGALALIPGVSRSGSTMTGGIFAGLNRRSGARFSFMMCAVAVVASLLVEGYHAWRDDLFQYMAPLPTLVGILVACVVGYLAIRFMLKIITRVPMTWFALYMAILGLVYLVLQLTGNPMVPPFTPAG